MFAKITMAAATILPVMGVFGEEFKWPPPPSGYNKDATDIPKGTLTPSTQYPTRNHNNRPVRIYTPPGYSKDRAEKYPVLYLHHGIGGNENAWTSQPGSSNEGNADKVLNYLYSKPELKVVPMIIVMPFGNIDGWDNYEDVLLKDLIPYVEKNYNASSDPNMRAMAGLSWGGGQTLTYAYRHLDVFTWIGGFSPAPNSGTPAGNIKDIAGVKAKVHLNYFAGGNKAPANGGFDERQFLATSRSFHNYLVQNGVTNVILQEENGLEHEAENWNRQLHHFAQRIFKLESTDIKFQIQARTFKSGAQAKFFNLTASGMMIVNTGSNLNTSPSFSIDGREIRLMGIPTGK